MMASHFSGKEKLLRGSGQRWAAFLLTFLAVALPGHAQNSNAGASPKVVQLYSQAHAAQARGDSDQAIAIYRQIIKIAPHLAAAYNNLGLIYYGKHDYAAAIPVLREGLLADPKMTASWVLLGASQFAAGDDPEAEKSLKESLKRNPEDGQVELMLAHVLVHRGDETGAAACLQRLTSHDPRNQEAWYLLGKIYLQLSQSALDKVQQIDPHSALSHVMSGEIMESMQNYDGALIEFKKAVEIDPQKGGAQDHLANVYWELGQWNTARSAFQQVLSREPQNCTAQWKAADCLVKQHLSPDKALQELDEAIRHCANLMPARVDRARVLIDAGKPAEARSDLEAAEKASPDEPSIHFLLAKVYRSQHLAAKAEAETKAYAQLQASASDRVARRAAEVQELKADPQ